MLENKSGRNGGMKPWHSTRTLPCALFCVIFLWGAALRFYTLTDPFPFNFHGENGSYLSLTARNWVRHGLEDLRLLQVIDGGPLLAGSEVYTHHPPLVPALVALNFRFSGSFREGWARMVPVTFSLGTLALLYLIVRRIWTERIALLAAFCYALVPYATYYATDVCYETGSQFFFLFILYWYRRYVESPRVLYFAAMCLGLTLGALNDWPAFFTVPILGAHWLWRFPGRRRVYVFLYPALAAVLAGLFLWAIAQTEGTWKIAQITALFKVDSAAPSPSGAPPYTLYQWLSAVVWHGLFYFCTPVVMLLVMGWAVGLLLRFVRRRVTEPDVWLSMLLVYGALYVGLGHSWAFNHKYWATLLLPGLSIAAALMLDWIYQTPFGGLARRPRTVLLYTALALFGLFCTHRLRLLYAEPLPDFRAVARVMGENTRFEDSILTSLDLDFVMLMRFYSDRNIYFGVRDPAQFLDVYRAPYRGISWAGGPPLGRILPKSFYDDAGPAYRYFFLDATHQEACAALYDFLKTAYRMRRVSGFLIFDLRDPIRPDAARPEGSEPPSGPAEGSGSS